MRFRSSNEVFGSRAYFKLVEDCLASIETFGLTKLRYTVRIIEMSDEQAEHLTKGWRVLGRSDSLVTNESHASAKDRSVVVPASHTSTANAHEFSMSSVLSDEQVAKIVHSGKMISAPKLIGQNGKAVKVRIGEVVPFTTSYASSMDPDANALTTMQPITTG